MEIAHLKMWQRLLLTQHPFSLIFSACFSPTHKAFSLQSGQGGVREVTRRPLQSVVKGHAPLLSLPAWESYGTGTKNMS